MEKESLPLVDIKDMAIYTGLSLISKGLKATPLKLQKILYYEQAWFMVFFGRENTLFADIPQAWVNGPVYPNIFHEYKDKVANMCDSLNETHFTKENIDIALEKLANNMNFNKGALELIDSIITLYGSKTQNDLIFLTHSELPWVEAREGLAPFQSSQKQISQDTMYYYYKERHERNRNKS